VSCRRSTRPESGTPLGNDEDRVRQVDAACARSGRLDRRVRTDRRTWAAHLGTPSLDDRWGVWGRGFMFWGLVVAMISAVVFDLDGTLFDHFSSARRGLRQWPAGLDVVLTNDLASAWFEAEERHAISWREGVVSWAEQWRRRRRDFLPLIGVSVGTADDLDEAFVAGYLSAGPRVELGWL